jgi:hypothetical protein
MTSPTRVPPPALHATQRRLSAWIRGSSAPDPEAVAALLRADDARPPLARLGVYANAFFLRIHGALRDDFGAVAALVGDEAFGALARAYLGAHPTTRPSLRDAGEHLPRYLARDPRAADVRARHGCAADLAALEWALVEAFDAPDAPVLGRDAFAAVPPDGWGALRLRPTPSLQRLALDWPVQRVKQAFDTEGEAAARAMAATLRPEPTQLRVWRRDERVFHRAMDVAESTALDAIASEEPFEALCERLAVLLGPEEAVPRAAALLETWLADGLLVGIA